VTVGKREIGQRLLRRAFDQPGRHRQAHRLELDDELAYLVFRRAPVCNDPPKFCSGHHLRNKRDLSSVMDDVDFVHQGRLPLPDPTPYGL